MTRVSLNKKQCFSGKKPFFVPVLKMRRVNLIWALLLIVLKYGKTANPPSCPRILSKTDWGGRAPKTIELAIIPLKYVIVDHTVTSSCNDEDTCAALLTNIQSNHMEDLGFHDIGYNFMIGGDGNVYEGTGWHKVGAHTIGYNSQSIGIAFIGTFTNELPNQKQLDVAKKFLQCAIDKGELDQSYKLRGGKSVISAQRPSKKLFKELKSWKGSSLSP